MIWPNVANANACDQKVCACGCNEEAHRGHGKSEVVQQSRTDIHQSGQNLNDTTCPTAERGRVLLEATRGCVKTHCILLYHILGDEMGWAPSALFESLCLFGAACLVNEVDLHRYRDCEGSKPARTVRDAEEQNRSHFLGMCFFSLTTLLHC